MTSTPEIDLTLRVGRMAYQYGLPAYELEDLSTDVATAAGLRVSVISNPRYLDVTIDDASAAGQVRFLVRLDEVSYNLRKLSKTLKLTEGLLTGAVGVDEAGQRLDEK